MADSEREYVDLAHPYITDHNADEFVWDFDGEDAVEYASSIVTAVVQHAEQHGAAHAVADFSVQAGMLLADVKEGTQFPVLMYNDGIGNIPFAVLLVDQALREDARLPLAHTLGSLLTEDGFQPALPSAAIEQFENPTQEDDST